jgi:hypothetical protein
MCEYLILCDIISLSNVDRVLILSTPTKDSNAAMYILTPGRLLQWFDLIGPISIADN